MRREAKLLMMLDHPGIVECYDVIDDGQQMVIVMVRLRPAYTLPEAVCVAKSRLSWLLLLCLHLEDVLISCKSMLVANILQSSSSDASSTLQTVAYTQVRQ